MSEEGILKKIDDIWNYCEEIDNHLSKEEQTGYKMLPDIFYIKKEVRNLQQKVEQLEKEVNEYQKELEKADSITQSCIFQGKQESKISFRNCLNRLEQLENIRKETIEYVLKNKLYRFKYDDEELFEITTDKKAKDDLLNILNKGE